MKLALIALLFAAATWAAALPADAAEPIRLGECCGVNKAFGFTSPQVAHAARSHAVPINAKGGK